MNLAQIVTLAASLVAAVIGLAIGIKATTALFRRKTYSPSNANELLHLERPEEWNEVRILHPEWQPDLTGVQLRGLSLPGINLRDACLDNSVLSDSRLDGANFERASLQNADLSRASLSDVSFLAANLRGATLKGANLARTRLEGAELAGATLADVVAREAEPVEEDLSKVLVQAKRSLDELSPRQFEELVADIFRSRGYDVALTSQTKDGGYDLVLHQADPVLGGQTFLVEIKKYRPDLKVGVSPVRALMGSVIANDAQRGILVTTSSFTSDARALAERSEQLRLIDGSELQELIKTLGFGSKTEGST